MLINRNTFVSVVKWDLPVKPGIRPHKVNPSLNTICYFRPGQIELAKSFHRCLSRQKTMSTKPPCSGLQIKLMAVSMENIPRPTQPFIPLGLVNEYQL